VAIIITLGVISTWVSILQWVIQAIGIPVKSILLVYPRLFNDKVQGFYFKERYCLQDTDFFFSTEGYLIEDI
jgi:hypothetical protein